MDLGNSPRALYKLWKQYLTSYLLCRYAVDSLLLLLQSIIATPAGYQFNPAYSRALTIAVYVGMLTGALFWGLSGDIVGRRFAFNTSLFICSIFTIIAGAAPNWVSLSVFIALLGFGGGGNLVMDTTVFIEYLPSKKQWVLSQYNAFKMTSSQTDSFQLGWLRGGVWDKRLLDLSPGASCVSCIVSELLSFG